MKANYNLEPAIMDSLFDYLNKVGFYDLTELYPIYKQSNPELIEDVRLRSAVYAGMGKNFCLEGDFNAARFSFDMSIRIADDNPKIITGDYLAFIYYEYALFQNQSIDYIGFKKYLKFSFRFAESEFMVNLINYQFSLLEAESENDPEHKGLERSIAFFKDKQMNSLNTMALFKIGIIYEKNKQWDKAQQSFDEGLQLAETHKIVYMVGLFKNALGYLFVLQARYDKALRYFDRILPDVESHYLKALIMENIANVHHLQCCYKSAVEWAHSANNYANTYHVTPRLPEECRFLGECYERLKEPGQALLHYRLGYEHAMDQVSAGLSLDGDRKRAITSYVDYLKQTARRKSNDVPNGEWCRFAIGREWREIRSLFQYHLIMHHKKKSSFAPVFLHELEMKPSTYYTLQGKLKNEAYDIPSIKDKRADIPADVFEKSLYEYIQNTLRGLTWNDANKKFETDIFRFLFEYYGFRKNKLAKALNMSAPIVKTKTSQIYKIQHIVK